MVAVPLNFIGNQIIIVGGGRAKNYFLGGGGGAKFKGGLQHFTSRKLAEANLLVNIKKMFFYVCCQKCQSYLFVCLSLLSACLSVKLQWTSQVTREMQGNSNSRVLGML